MWQQLLGHMASVELFVPRDRARMHLFHWQLKYLWSVFTHNPAMSVPFKEKSHLCIRHWLWERESVRVLLHFFFCLPMCMCLRLAREHIYKTFICKDSVCQERNFISVLKIRAVQLTLKAFLDRIIRQSITHMNDNATVLAYLKKQGRTVSMAIHQFA